MPIVWVEGGIVIQMRIVQWGGAVSTILAYVSDLKNKNSA